MTLMTAKALLTARGIDFAQQDYPDEATFYRCCFAVSPRKARPKAVCALLIRSKNGRKHLILQFLQKNHQVVFEELFFGEYAFEFFNHAQTALAEDLMDTVLSVISGQLHILITIAQKNGRLLADAAYVLTADPAKDDTIAYEAALRRVMRPRRGLKKWLMRAQSVEIYNWNSYRQIHR